MKQNLHNPEFDVLSQDVSLFKPESVDRWMDNSANLVPSPMNAAAKPLRIQRSFEPPYNT